MRIQEIYFITSILAVLFFAWYGYTEHNSHLFFQKVSMESHEKQREYCFELKRMCEKYEPEKAWRYN